MPESRDHFGTLSQLEEKSKYGGMEASDVKRLKAWEEENNRLKKMYAELSLEHQAVKDLIVKKGW
jgi:putative transposase